MSNNQKKYQIQTYSRVIHISKEMLIDDDLKKSKTLGQEIDKLCKSIINFKTVVLQASKWWLLPIVNYLSRRLK